MNGKTAKALRREAGFDPNKTPREYGPLEALDMKGRLVKFEGTRVNYSHTPRAKYQKLKKQYKGVDV